jgi:hypothetical protein
MPTLYETWKKSPEVQYTEHGPLSFLENADGKPVKKSEITRITKSLRSSRSNDILSSRVSAAVTGAVKMWSPLKLLPAS